MATPQAFKKEKARDKAVEGETPAEPTYKNPQEETKRNLEETTPQETSVPSGGIGNKISSADEKAILAQGTGRADRLNNRGMGDS